jgi:hypothetical protein
MRLVNFSFTNRVINSASRRFSTPAASVEASSSSSSGSTLGERLGSFFVGFGLGAAINMTMVYTELSESNKRFDLEVADLRSRINELESK